MIIIGGFDDASNESTLSTLNQYVFMDGLDDIAGSIDGLPHLSWYEALFPADPGKGKFASDFVVQPV